MSIFLFISLLIGSIVFLFTLWKGLREDYKINSIFTFGFSVLFFVFAGLFLSSVINRGIWLWAAVLGMCFGLLLGVAKTGIRLLRSSFTSIFNGMRYDGAVFEPL